MCQKCLDALYEVWPGLPWEAHSALLWNCTPFPFDHGACVRESLQDLYDRSGGDVGRAMALADGQTFSLGDHTLSALHTPGHSPGHFCFLCENRLITGDLLFCGKIGGTGPYFPGSSPEQQYSSLEKICQLPDSVLVFPGHDYYGGEGSMPHSTIGFEKNHNPFLLVEDFAGVGHKHFSF